MTNTETLTPPKAARFLERALIANIVIHFIAMGAMALLLLPAMPGGGVVDDALRVARIADHPWLWRLGWLPWQLTAALDLLLGIALLRTPWIRKTPALIATLLTLAAIVPDQIGQFLWITRGVDLAQKAIHSGKLHAYLEFEVRVFPMVAAWGCLGYLLGALGWTYCFAEAKIWNRGLTWLSIATWSVFALAIVIIFLPARLQPPSAVAAVGNAVGFVLLQIWLIAITESVLRRSRLFQTHGRSATWRAPSHGAFGRCQNLIANSSFARAICTWLPSITLVSDITDVVYINYLVKADRLLPFVPHGLSLQRLGPGGAYAMFSILTYRHGQFGPRLPRLLRRAFFSPIQSNWRIYVFDPTSRITGVYFITTAISSVSYAIGARLLSEGMPMHVPRSATMTRYKGSIRQEIDPGDGSAPDLRVDLHILPDQQSPTLTPPWSECFATFGDFLAYTVPQDRALSSQPWYGQITRQEIDLPIPLQSCRVLEGEVLSRAATQIIGDATPLCFIVPSVSFRFYAELRRKAGLPPV